MRLNHLIFSFFVFSLSFAYAEPLKLSVDSEAAILINAKTGAILFEKNARTPQFPASTTKIAVAAYALQLSEGNLKKMLVVENDCVVSVPAEKKRKANYTLPAHWLEPDGTHISLRNGEIMSLEDLLNGMLLCSGNDAANVVAKEVGGTIPRFVEGLNAYVKKLGCQGTHFCNPHGLHDPKHVTTAFDLALMTIAALKDPVFRGIVLKKEFVRPKTNKQEKVTLPQTNRLLRQGEFYYPKAIGVKTGYTASAQRNLVAAATDGNRTLVAVLLKNKDRSTRYKDAIKLFEAAFNQPKMQRILMKEGPQKHFLQHEGAAAPIKTYLRESVISEFYPAEDPDLVGLLFWNKIVFPVEKDQCVGRIEIRTDKGEIIRSVPLFSQERIKSTWGYWLKSFWL